MISFEFHFQPDGRGVHVVFDSFEYEGGMIDHAWRTRSYLYEDQLRRLEQKKAISDTDAEKLLGHCLKQKLEWLVIHAEDCILNIQPNGNIFKMVTFDCVTGKTFTNNFLTAEQVNAIVILAVFGDDYSHAEQLFPVAEAALVDCPHECRPMP